MNDKYKRMSDDEIEKLIKARMHHAGLFKKKFYKRNEIWLEIQRKGGLWEYSPDQLRLKWNYLYKKYKELLSPPTGINTEDGEETAESWKWFGLIHGFGNTQHAINPLISLSSVPGCTHIAEVDEEEVDFEEEGEEVNVPGPSVSPIPKRNTANKSRKRETLIDLYKKDSKIIKKTGKCIQQFLQGYSIKENIPFTLPSSDSE